MKNKKIGNVKLGEIQIIKERIAFNNKYGTLYNDEVAFPSGSTGKYLRFEWVAPYSVAVLPITNEGKIVLIKIFRHAQRRWVLEIPKGFGSEELDASTVARKELLEETGIKAVRIENLIEVSSDPGFIANPIKIFVAYGCEFCAPPEPEPSETIKGTLIFNTAEALHYLKKDHACDAITRLAILEFASKKE